MTSDVDTDAFAHIVDRYTPMVLARCQRELGPADADDAVQAVFLVLWRRWHEAPTAGPGMSSWLYQTAGLVVKRAHRDRTRRRRAEDRAPLPAEPVPGPDASIEVGEARRLLDAALAALPAVEREAVVLSHLSGHSYAEVAAHQGCSKATVANRVRDGLDSLRRALARRGCALSVPALVGLMAAEADAATPAGLLDRLHRLPSACRDGTTTAVLGATIIRWSRRELPIMRIIGTTTATLAVAGLIAWFGSAGPVAAGDAPAAAAPPVAETVPAAGDPLATWEQLRADQIIYLRWHRPERTWARLRETPLGAMVPPAIADQVAAQLAGIDRVEVALDSVSATDADVDATLTPELRRASLAALQGEPGAQRDAALETMRMVLEQAADPAKPAPRTASFGPMPAQHTMVRVVVSDAAARERCQAMLDSGFGGRMAWRREGERLVADGDQCRLEAGSDAGGLFLSLRPTWCTNDLPADELAWDESRDVQLRSVIRPRRPEAYAAATKGEVATSILSMEVELWLDGGEMRLRSFIPTQAGQSGTGPSRAVSASTWRQVPTEALIAGACAIGRDDVGMQSILLGLVAPVLLMGSAKDESLSQACVDLAYGVDGDLVGYLQQGGMGPALTLALDVPAQRCAAFLDALAVRGEAGRAAEPMAPVRIRTPMAIIEVGHRDGRLIVTTDPAGIAGFGPQGDGFVTAPDVAAGMLAGGDAPSTARLIMRTGRLLELAMPMVALAGLPPEQTALLTQAATRLREQPEAGWLVARSGADGTRAEAGGAVALLAALLMSAPMAPRGVN